MKTEAMILDSDKQCLILGRKSRKRLGKKLRKWKEENFQLTRSSNHLDLGTFKRMSEESESARKVMETLTENDPTIKSKSAINSVNNKSEKVHKSAENLVEDKSDKVHKSAENSVEDKNKKVHKSAEVARDNDSEKVHKGARDSITEKK
ncbi:spermatid-specific thioredoxin [Lasius niger]|uniref:Spermatid-specific thioredoxin n=1 Tax=Lasius niger TaxID=67767 RepID=A0A0J7K6J8_LASNI|nr:spermatid-specific thioredoxin [Lasius niger]